MHSDEKNNNSMPPGNVLYDMDALYTSAENTNRLEAIKKSDTEKFLLFTRMMRISSMLKNAKITYKKNS